MILNLQQGKLSNAKLILTQHDLVANGALVNCEITLVRTDADTVLNVHDYSTCTVNDNYATDINTVKSLADGQYSIQQIATMLGIPFKTVQGMLKTEEPEYHKRRALYKLQQTLDLDLAIAEEAKDSSIVQVCARRHVSPMAYHKRVAQYKAYGLWL